MGLQGFWDRLRASITTNGPNGKTVKEEHKTYKIRRLSPEEARRADERDRAEVLARLTPTQLARAREMRATLFDLAIESYRYTFNKNREVDGWLVSICTSSTMHY